MSFSIAHVIIQIGNKTPEKQLLPMVFDLGQYWLRLEI